MTRLANIDKIYSKRHIKVSLKRTLVQQFLDQATLLAEIFNAAK